LVRIAIFLLDRIHRIDWIYCCLCFRLPAIASRSGEADGDETEKWQSRFQRERKAKETDCIITERSCRFFIVFLLPKELSRRGLLGLVFQ